MESADPSRLYAFDVLNLDCNELATMRRHVY
jgi:hypothetical protein